MSDGEYSTPADLARLLKVSPDTVRLKARTGEWPSSRIGTQYRFEPEAVDQIRELIRTPKPEPTATGSIRDLIARLA